MTELEENFNFYEKQTSTGFNESKNSSFAQALGEKRGVKQMIRKNEEKEIIVRNGKSKKIVKNRKVNVEQKIKKGKQKVVKV